MTGIGGGSAGGTYIRDVTYRHAREEDLLETPGVWKSALNELRGCYNLPQITAPAAGAVPLHRHFLREDGPRFCVAEAHGRVIGFGAGIVRGDWWYLGALFVLPEAQGLGVGRTLIGHARTGCPRTGWAATIADALQPVSNTLYAHHGLLPWLPVVGLQGRPSPVTKPSLPRGYEALPLDPALLDEVRPIDESVTGLDRTRDHAYLLSEEGARQGWVLCRDGRSRGYVYVTDSGLIGPAAATRPQEMTLLIQVALACLTEQGAEKVYAAVPGPNAEAQRALLQAGLVFDACPGTLLVSRPFGRFDRYVISSYALM
jgi:GNAT superfamily N-acetyltransferase